MWIKNYIRQFPSVRGVAFFYHNGFFCRVQNLYFWRPVAELTPQQINQLTLIEMSKQMILLDMDDCTKEQEEKISEELKALNINHETYETNRGYHFHIFVKDLNKYTDKEVVEIRKNLIEHFKADPCKAHGGMMAIPEKPHFKTGKIVRQIRSFSEGWNKTLPKQFYQFKPIQKYQPINDWNPDVDCPLFEYCCNNKLKENTGRGLHLLRNMSAYLVNKYPSEKAKKQFKRLCEKQNIYQYHWIDYQKEKKEKLSCGFIRKWLRETQYCQVEEFTCWRCEHGKSKN